MHYIDIAPSRPLTGLLTYAHDERLEVGTRVEVPIGKSTCFGFVINPDAKKHDGVEPKNIIRVCDKKPYFSPKNLELYKWVSDYYHYPLGETLSLITPSFITKKELKISEGATSIARRDPLVDLTDEQLEALRAMRDDVEQSKYGSKNLLHGVTGSGKTEVYIELAKDAVAEGKGVLIIVPEIALTPQLINRIAVHFNGEISVLHSGLTPKKRYENWMKLATGKSLVCIGARSAIFAPMPSIGLVVVDEEQDSSYKQDDRLRYNARDLSFVIAKIFGSKVVLSSATPSMESIYNSKQGKLKYIYIKNRVRGLCLPSTVLVDMKKARMGSYNMSQELINQIKETMDKGAQTILYINRRGYSHTIMCRACGKSIYCSKCSITMTEHKKQNLLLCHYCGAERSLPNYCTYCGSHDVQSIGSGTERIYEEIKTLFPHARVVIMDSDRIDSKKKLEEILDKISKKHVDIIIGTQILGKGHDFPDVNLVGVINTDTMLQLPDFRSSERVFHQIMQVSGRSGRMCQGKVVVQSYLPEHFAVSRAVHNDFEGFYSEEINNRKEAFYPPFAVLVDIKLSSISKKDASSESESITKDILNIINKHKITASILGPSPSPIAIINNKHRYHVLIKGKSRSELNKLIKIFNSDYKRKSKIKINIDVDPGTLF